MGFVRNIFTVFLAFYSTSIFAQAYTGSLSSSIGGGSLAGAMPVGIVANPLLRDALQAAQLDAACVGNDSYDCMPSLSSVELATLVQSGFGDEWGLNYGLTAFGSGVGATPVVCEMDSSGPQSDAARVAARHLRFGCVASNPDGLLSNLASLFQLDGDLESCMSTVENVYAAGAIGFAPADAQSAHYRFIKFDNEAPDLASFTAGNYAMFGDIHGTQLPNTTLQPWGLTGSLSLASGTPSHQDSGSFNVSNECAAGLLRNRTGGDLVN